MSVIREYRVNKGMTQIELANKLNVTPITIKRWEKKTTSPTLKQANAIYNILRIPLGKLINDYKEEK